MGRFRCRRRLMLYVAEGVAVASPRHPSPRPLIEPDSHGLQNMQTPRTRIRLPCRWREKERRVLCRTAWRMLRAGTISKDMHDAARDFQAAFTIARFDAIRCMPLVRLPGSSGELRLTEAQLDARRRVGEALDALGGLGSPAGSCVWHVVGLQCSIREWAMRQGWGGRPVRIEQAQGILVAALGVLVGWYGYDGR